MTLPELLAGLADAGVMVAVVDGKLRYGPKDQLTPDLAAALRTHRAAILAQTQCSECRRELTTPETKALGICLRCMSSEHYTRTV